VVAGGLAVLPAAASAQDPVASASPAGSPAAADVADPRGCAAPVTEDRLAQDDPPAPASAAAPPVPAAPATHEDEADQPVARCSQDAGENQYRDPFANSPPPDGGGGGGGAGSAQTPDTGASDGSVTDTSTLQQDGTAVAAQTDPEAAPGPSLPESGLGLGGLVALGLPLLGAGLALRARLA
jgi:hypothetical protein